MEILEGLTTFDVVCVAVIFLVGGLVKGAIGFGLPLVTITVLPFVIRLDVALAINAMMLPLTNVTQFVQAGRMRETVYRIRYVIAGVIVGVPLGAALVSAISNSYLMLALGFFVLAFVALTVYSPQLSVPPAREREVAGTVGLLAGIVGALTTTNGPLFVMHLVALKVERTVFVSALGLLFVISGILISGAFWVAGLMNFPRLALAAICLPAALVGMSAGNMIGKYIPAEIFRRLILVVLSILALNLVAQGLAEL